MKYSEKILRFAQDDRDSFHCHPERSEGSVRVPANRISLARQCAPYGRAGHWKLVISVNILKQNSANTTHMTGLISFTLPVTTLSTTQVMMANMMPVAME